MLLLAIPAVQGNTRLALRVKSGNTRACLTFPRGSGPTPPTSVTQSRFVLIQ